MDYSSFPNIIPYNDIQSDVNNLNPFSTQNLIQNLNTNNQYLHSQLSSIYETNCL